MTVLEVAGAEYEKLSDRTYQKSAQSIQDAQPLRDCVLRAMKNYFMHLDGQEVTDVYNMVLSEIEAPLLESVMTHVEGNQSRAAHLLGLNRGTLRKKLKRYDLL